MVEGLVSGDEVQIDWGDGTVSAADVDLGLGIATGSHTYRDEGDNGEYPLQLLVNGDVIDTANVIVDNALPILTVSGSATGTEGNEITVAGSYDDPGPDDTHTVLWEVNSDNGQTVPAGNDSAISFTPNDDGNYFVSYTVTDNDGGESSETITIAVENASPTIAVAETAELNEGDTLTLGGSFADPGNDTWTATVEYGDGTVPESAVP